MARYAGGRHSTRQDPNCEDSTVADGSWYDDCVGFSHALCPPHIQLSTRRIRSGAAAPTRGSGSRRGTEPAQAPCRSYEQPAGPTLEKPGQGCLPLRAKDATRTRVLARMTTTMMAVDATSS
jgi:hypothetical protein